MKNNEINEINEIEKDFKYLQKKLNKIKKLPDYRNPTAVVNHYLPLVFPGIVDFKENNFVNKKNEKMSISEIKKEIKNQLFADFPKVSIYSFAKNEEIEAELLEIKQQFIENEKNQLFERIKFNPSSNSSKVDNVLKMLTKNPELDCIVFRHMAWQVKRNIVGKNVETPLVAILFGNQGTGKSRFWQDFFSVIGQSITSTSLSTFVAGNQAFSLRNQLVVDFSELDAGNSNAVVARAKQLLTDSTITGKLLYQNESTTRKINSYVGSTNYPLSTVFPDYTGYRRFHVIDFMGDVLNNFINMKSITYDDWCDYWSSINENRDSPLFSNDYYVSMLKRENAKIGNEIIIKLISHFTPSTGGFSKKTLTKITEKELFEKYEYFCGKNGVKKKMRLDFDDLCEKIKEINGEKFVVKKSQLTTYYVFYK